MEKIIISLATIGSRLDKLDLTLDSLLAQDYPNLEVRVFASREPYLIDEGVKALPPKIVRLLRNDSRLCFFFSPNIGPYRKLLPVLYDKLGTNCLVATADDDTIYPAEWLSTLYDYYRRFNCVIAYRGHQMVLDKGEWQKYRVFMRAGVQQNLSLLCLPTGKDGVLYNSMFFHPNVLDVVRATNLATTVDDLWFKWHTAMLDVPTYIIRQDYSSGSLVDTNTGSSLYKTYNEKGGNDAAIERLEAYARHSFGMTLAQRCAARV